jgi:hypothetical protein
MYLVLPVSSILQLNWNHNEDPGLEFFKATDYFEPTFIELYQTSKMICKVRFLKSQSNIGSLLDEINSSSNEGFTDIDSDRVVGNQMQSYPTQETAKSSVISK